MEAQFRRGCGVGEVLTNQTPIGGARLCAHLVSVEEHDSTRIVQLVHRVEVWHLTCIHEVDDRVVLDELRN